MMRAMDKWFPGYLSSVFRRPRADGPFHVLYCLADHHEPFRGGADKASALAIVRRWRDEFPRLVARHQDADGRYPVVTLFYPEEEYDPEVMAELAGLARDGYAEIEVQLHHRHDTAAGFRSKLTGFRDRLHGAHGLLGTDKQGAPRYGFVHGNWALCNSRADGDWCGVNEELAVLSETGCYADFTFPSAPSPTQPRMVNTLYRAVDAPGRPRGHDRGRVVRVDSSSRDGLMLVTGPLAPFWGRRKWGVFPRLENGEISGANPPTGARLDAWVRQHIHVRGNPNWIVVKVHTHGCVAENANLLLSERMEWAIRMVSTSESWTPHFVSARELYNIIRAAEDGHRGDPSRYRDYEISPPGVRVLR